MTDGQRAAAISANPGYGSEATPGQHPSRQIEMRPFADDVAAYPDPLYSASGSTSRVAQQSVDAMPGGSGSFGSSTTPHTAPQSSQSAARIAFTFPLMDQEREELGKQLLEEDRQFEAAIDGLPPVNKARERGYALARLNLTSRYERRLTPQDSWTRKSYRRLESQSKARAQARGGDAPKDRKGLEKDEDLIETRAQRRMRTQRRMRNKTHPLSQHQTITIMNDSDLKSAFVGYLPQIRV